MAQILTEEQSGRVITKLEDFVNFTKDGVAVSTDGGIFTPTFGETNEKNKEQQRKLEEWLEKAGWKHKHDGWPEHSIAVKYHNTYFLNNAKNAVSINNISTDNFLDSFSKFRKSLSNYEWEVLQKYVNWNYLSINESLRLNKKIFRIEEKVRIMDSLFEKQLFTNALLYRSALIPESIVDTLNIGTIFQDRGFISTSITSKVAFGFPGVARDPKIRMVKIFFTIDSKGKIPVIFGNLHEDEIILKRGTKFLIRTRKKIRTGIYSIHLDVIE